MGDIPEDLEMDLSVEHVRNSQKVVVFQANFDGRCRSHDCQFGGIHQGDYIQSNPYGDGYVHPSCADSGNPYNVGYAQSDAMDKPTRFQGTSTEDMGY